jgi:hypothetical protein
MFFVGFTPYEQYGDLIKTWKLSSGYNIGYWIRIATTIILIIFFDKLNSKFGKIFYLYFVVFYLGHIGDIIFNNNMLLKRSMFPIVSLNIIVYSFLLDFLFKSKKQIYVLIGISIIGIYILYFIGQIMVSNNACSPFQFIFQR